MKFSIRDILWLTILVAISVTWWLDHRAGLQRQRHLQEQLEETVYAAQLERAERVLSEARRALNEAAISVEQASLESQASERLLESKRATESLASPSP